MSTLCCAISREAGTGVDYRSRKLWQRWRWLPVVLLLVVVATAGPAMAGAQQLPTPQHPFHRLTPNDVATWAGFHDFYNLQYKDAIANFEKSLSDHPGDPYAINHLLEAVLFQELHREGKLDAQLYLSNEFVHAKNSPPSQQTVDRIQNLTQQAMQAEDRQLTANPKDESALYARAVTLGLRAINQALIDKAWFSALRSGLNAYNYAKQALQLDPSASDPKLIVGLYNYVAGSLPWPVKIAAFLATIHGSKSKGLVLIREAAYGGGEASVDARATLGLFLAREHRYKESLELTEWLYTAFPHNFLFGLSVADLLKSDGKPSEAIEAYRHLIELGKKGWFPTENSGMAAMELGTLLRSRHDWRGAAEAYDMVGTLPNPKADLTAHAQLAAGQMYDLMGERPLAVKKYTEAADGAGSSTLGDEARRYLKRPYKGD